MLRPAQLDETLIGHPLPWDLYTAAGVLMAAAGMVVSDASQLEKLREQELFCQSGDDVDCGDFIPRLHACTQALHILLSPPHTATLGESILHLAHTLHALHQHDAEACLGLTRLNKPDSPAVRHCLLTAFVTAAIGEALGEENVEIERQMAAALTMNISEMALHDALAKGTRALGEAERQALHTHPQGAVLILSQHGIRDPIWLAAVQYHHENMDGSGYPSGLQGQEIPLAARLLRIADYYSAKLESRYYRAPKSAEQAMTEIFGRERGKLDNHLATQLLRRLGTHPPGTIVRLENRETAIIARRYGRKLEVRKVVSFLDYRDRPMEAPTERDTSHRAYMMTGTREQEPSWSNMPWEKMWGY